MRIAMLTLCLLGCATTPSSTSASSSTAAVVAEPEGKLCTSNDGCSGATCVKAADATQGVCSQLSTGAACRASKDCMSGSFCHRPVGFNGVCFKP